jgi:S-adenosylmethionine-diacylgycerolhomoserine-N-methlytransferase
MSCVFIHSSNRQLDENSDRTMQFCDSLMLGGPAVIRPSAVTPLSREWAMEDDQCRSEVAPVITLSRSELPANAAWPADATSRMNRMYRWQRHIYDSTRRFYLLGRDQLIAGLNPRSGETVLEVGCGTGRNLVQAATRFPGARFFGLDVSTEMLTSAIGAIDRAGLTGAVRVAHGDATAFKPQPLFGEAAFDHIMISYSLSMIPNFGAVLERAAAALQPGGRLHIVDFGDQRGLPRFARTLLRRWLTMFGVTPRDELETVLQQIAARAGAALSFERPFRGYAQYAVLRFPARQNAP